MYPIKFLKNFKEKVWGGRQFHLLLNLELPDSNNYGESWEVCSHKNGMSIVENGKYRGWSLEQLSSKMGKELLGEEIIEKYNNKFPLLIKYLDINDKLSVQVHPSDEYALRVEGEFGKYESWFIIAASEDAKIILGVNAGVTKNEFGEKVRKNDFSNLFREVKVKKGDFIDIVPGLVHASLEGRIVVCEVQQNSDTTYRIFDFDRVVNGKKRELHTEKALEVIDYTLVPTISLEGDRETKKFERGFIEKLSFNNYYKIDRIKLNGGSYSPNPYKNFKIQSIIDGSGYFLFNDEKIILEKGDTYLIPANFSVTITGHMEILESYI